MRVLPVAQALHALGVHAQPRRQERIVRAHGGRGAARPRIAQIGCDRGVVLGGAAKRLLGQAIARRVGQGAARPQLLEHRRVLARIGDHAHALVVLGRAADHAGPADVDVLDGVGQRAIGVGHGLLERVERHDDQVDGPDAVLLQRRHVLGKRAAGEDAPVNLGVQGLHPSMEHLREAGHLGDVHHLQPAVAQERGGAPGGEDLHAERGQTLGEVHDAALVVHADECPIDPVHALLMRARRAVLTVFMRSSCARLTQFMLPP
jgi:hypothetical protein